jgi:hypothetical protein
VCVDTDTDALKQVVVQVCIESRLKPEHLRHAEHQRELVELVPGLTNTANTAARRRLPMPTVVPAEAPQHSTLFSWRWEADGVKLVEGKLLTCW